MQQCNALTRNYKRCRQVAVPGSTMCQSHIESHAPTYTRQSMPAYKTHAPEINLKQYSPLETTRSVSKSNYHAYLESREWKQKAEAKKKENPRCSLCNREIKVMHTHHRTYVRCGKEEMYDLTVLCEDCHSLFHEHYEYNDIAGCFVPK